MRFGVIIALFILNSFDLPGQLGYFESSEEFYHQIDRLYTRGLIDYNNSSVRSYSIDDVMSLTPDKSKMNSIEEFEWKKLIKNTPEYLNVGYKEAGDSVRMKGFFSNFYKTPYSFYHLNTDNFFLKIDPVIRLEFGDDSYDNNLIFQNTRGIKIRGIIDNKIFFSSSIFENQQRFLNYIENEIERLNAIPGQGFFRSYQSGIIDNLNGWDFLNSSAYFGFKISNSINLRMGHGRHFIGHGKRSLLLSDYANNYFYLQLNTRIWKFHYQNTFAELTARSNKDLAGDNLLPKKYFVAHYLDLQVNRKLSIGIFESVVFSRENNFELQYLNPVIFYRSVEQFLDSPDNALFGLNIQYIPKSKWEIYGQLMLDELKTSELFSGDGWWGNKVAYQLGIKKFDLFNVPNLDVQIEHNTARPYTYAHRSQETDSKPITSYSHFNQPLAHPYGANFRETLITLKYRPHKKIYIDGLLLLSEYGDSETQNVGRDILISYESRPSDFNHSTGQGRPNNIVGLHFSASFEFFPNYFLDLNLIQRSQKSNQEAIMNTRYIGLGLRANISNSRITL